MFKVILVSFTLIASTLSVLHAKKPYLTDKQTKLIKKTCLGLHKVAKNKEQICSCLVRNLKEGVESKKDADFLEKYYKKNTKMPCGDQDMLCSFDFHIAEDCNKNPNYSIHEVDHNHGHD